MGHICADEFDDPQKRDVAVVVASPMLTAYFDESYNHPKDGSTEPAIYTVACYFGLRENWDAFRSEWNSALKEKGLERIGFHMNKFEWARNEAINQRDNSKTNPYRGWKPNEFDEFLDRLHGIIGAKALSGLPRIAPLATEVICADFDEARPDDLRDDPECCSYYLQCVTNIMNGIAVWANRNHYYEPINYVFAKLESEAGNLAAWFDYCWKHPEIRNYYRLGKGFARVPHDRFQASSEPALQAADIAAYEMNKQVLRWIANNYADLPLSDLRKALNSLVRTDYWGWVLRKKEMEEGFAEIRNTRRRFPV